jgi:hypothetical protein
LFKSSFRLVNHSVCANDNLKDYTTSYANILMYFYVCGVEWVLHNT